MKKFLKSRLFFFIFGLIIATTVGVSASILYQASEIGFTPQNPNWKVNNLESALNDLYENAKEVSEYDNKIYSTEGIEETSNRVTITNGGYYIDNNGVTYINITFLVNSTMSNDDMWTIFTGFPAPSEIITVNDLEMKHAYQINTQGRVYFVNNRSYYSLPAGTTWNLQFKY